MFKASISPEEIAALEIVSFPGDIVVVDSVGEAFFNAISYLRKQEIIGFDTETRPVFSPEQHSSGTALLQLSGPDRAFLFRLNKMGLPKELCSVLASSKIVKVGAATGDDVRGLQRLAPFQARSFVDLQKIVAEWGIEDKSVKKMSAIILGVKISKAQQLSNWEASNLTEPQRKYAATDAWICREMYLKLLSTKKNG